MHAFERRGSIRHCIEMISARAGDNIPCRRGEGGYRNIRRKPSGLPQTAKGSTKTTGNCRTKGVWVANPANLSAKSS